MLTFYIRALAVKFDEDEVEITMLPPFKSYEAPDLMSAVSDYLNDQENLEVDLKVKEKYTLEVVDPLTDTIKSIVISLQMRIESTQDIEAEMHSCVTCGAESEAGDIVTDESNSIFECRACREVAEYDYLIPSEFINQH